MSALDLLTKIDPSKPLSLGQLTMNADGVLEMRQAPPLQEAQFNLRGIPVRVRLHQPSGNDKTICDIIADCGPLPFSAQNSALRNLLLSVMKGFRPPADARVMLGARQHVWVLQQTTLTIPIVPAAVLTEVTLFVHHLGKIIGLLAEIQQQHAPRSGGQGRASSLKPAT
jgi:hypothetical protein